MAFFLTPRFAPAYQQCGPFACAPSRPSYRVSRPARPSFPSFVPFLSQLDELFSEIDREARRAAHQERQQRKKVFRARFDVRENQEGYEVEGEVPGFEQENISIEVTDEHTLKVAGNTEQRDEQSQSPTTTETAAAVEPETTETDNDKMDGVTLNEAEVEAAGSDTESHKSYQATVEDDFEDLGAETSSIVSASSTTTAAAEEPKEPKGKEKAVEESAPALTDTALEQSRAEENREWLSERVHGSFERTFQFPERIDAANVKAALRNGVLAIHVPKAPAPQIRQITIQ